MRPDPLEERWHTGFTLPASMILDLEALAIRAQTTVTVVAQALLEYAIENEEYSDERLKELADERVLRPERFKKSVRFGYMPDRPKDAYVEATQYARTDAAYWEARGRRGYEL